MKTYVIRNKKKDIKLFTTFGKRAIYLTLLLALCTFKIYGQDSNSQQLVLLNQVVLDGDTMPHINLVEVTIMPNYKFKNKKEYERYSTLVRNIKKTLPYARQAASKLHEINAKMLSLKTEKERKTFMESSESDLFKEFEQPLRKLTYSQGRLLIKLIDRETGETSFDLIKEYKGGFSAFFWQSVARVFGSNLKSEFDEDGEDKMIEYIINLIDNGMI